MLNLLRKSAARKELAARPVGPAGGPRPGARFFSRAWAFPTRMDGRFDLVALHAWLVLERLKAAGMDAAAQALTDTLFIGFDEALREQGTGDMGMGRRMKAMANAFYGRLAAYGARQRRGRAGGGAGPQCLARRGGGRPCPRRWPPMSCARAPLWPLRSRQRRAGFRAAAGREGGHDRSLPFRISTISTGWGRPATRSHLPPTRRSAPRWRDWPACWRCRSFAARVESEETVAQPVSAGLSRWRPKSSRPVW